MFSPYPYVNNYLGLLKIPQLRGCCMSIPIAIAADIHAGIVLTFVRLTTVKQMSFCRSP